MSYEDTNCPCGGTKDRQTMLCPACREAFNDRREMTEYTDVHLPVAFRRQAALVLVTLARGRRAYRRAA